MNPFLMAIATVVAIFAFVVFSYSEYAKVCTVHGGAHATFPYKSLPECWDAEGRRVFW
jgi:hypothetical protein